jgi:hypothetical protein
VILGDQGDIGWYWPGRPWVILGDIDFG